MVKLTRREAEYIVAAGAAVDFLTEGKFTGAVARRVKAAVRRAGPAAARTTASTAARLAGTGVGLAARGAGAVRFVAMRHPVGAALGLTYVAVQNRDQIANLLGQGYEIVDEATRPVLTEAAQIAGSVGAFPSQEMMGARGRFGEPIVEALGIKPVRKRKRSSYNKAVSSAMKAVKKSKFLGKPGKFTSPKKAFATVNRTVSRIKKGAKVGTKGVTGVIKRAVRRIL